MGFNSKCNQSNESIKQFFYHVVQSLLLTFASMEEILMHDHAHEIYLVQFSPVMLLFTLYKVVLTFESVDEIEKSDH